MEANNGNKNVVIKLNQEEALVLLEWLYKFNKEERPTLIQDQSEERILFDLEAVLEAFVSNTFENNYQEALLKARQKIRDIK